MQFHGYIVVYMVAKVDVLIKDKNAYFVQFDPDLHLPKATATIIMKSA